MAGATARAIERTSKKPKLNAKAPERTRRGLFVADGPHASHISRSADLAKIAEASDDIGESGFADQRAEDEGKTNEALSPAEREFRRQTRLNRHQHDNRRLDGTRLRNWARRYQSRFWPLLLENRIAVRHLYDAIQSPTNAR
jgi:hypothetical protein